MSIERKKYCVDGVWKESKTDKWMEVTDSSTGEVIAEVPCCTIDEVEEAIASAPPSILPSLLTLFAEIDRVDLLCEEYDLLHGKRTKPIRASLTNKFNEEELCRMRETVTHWNQAKYLKHRHLLVELRREQYTLRDSYRKIIFSEADATPEAEPIELGTDVDVLPLGLYDKGETASFVFRTLRGFDPNLYAEEVLEDISALYWKKKRFAPSAYQKWFDFRDAEHVYQLLNSEQELSIIAEEDDTAPLSHLMRTLQFYIRQAELPDIQSEILTMKLKKEKNTDIAYYINHKYGKSYTPNYISTIFKQKIVVKIAEAARMHEEVIANVFFPENFKQCSCCGDMLLRCPENFTRKGRATDGYAARCKICEKKARKGED